MAHLVCIVFGSGFNGILGSRSVFRKAKQLRHLVFIVKLFTFGHESCGPNPDSARRLDLSESTSIYLDVRHRYYLYRYIQ